jgi:hypothetical protein
MLGAGMRTFAVVLAFLLVACGGGRQPAPVVVPAPACAAHRAYSPLPAAAATAARVEAGSPR